MTEAYFLMSSNAILSHWKLSSRFPGFHLSAFIELRWKNNKAGWRSIKELHNIPINNSLTIYTQHTAKYLFGLMYWPSLQCHTRLQADIKEVNGDMLLYTHHLCIYFMDNGCFEISLQAVVQSQWFVSVYTFT